MRGPIEPSISGGPPGRTGAGRARSPRPGRRRRRSRTRPSASSRRTMVKASSKRETRWSKGKPKARYSRSFQPAPSPRISRPPEMPSTVAACLASIAGAWKPVDATRGPSSTRSVTAASAASDVHDLPRAPGRAVREVVEQVVAEPERVEPRGLGGPGHGDQLRPGHVPLHLGQLHADPAPTRHDGDCTESRPGRLGETPSPRLPACPTPPRAVTLAAVCHAPTPSSATSGWPGPVTRLGRPAVKAAVSRRWRGCAPGNCRPPPPPRRRSRRCPPAPASCAR